MMKFRIPDKKSYTLKIPEVHSWMKKEYCPVVAKALSPRSVHNRIKEYSKVEVDDYLFLSHSTNVLGGISYELNMCVNGHCPSAHKMSSFGDEMGNDEIWLDFHFYDGHASDIQQEFHDRKKYIALFPIDTRLFLLPYMFRAVNVMTMQMDVGLKFNPTKPMKKRTLLVHVPQHWDYLENFGIIPAGTMDRCKYLYKGK